VPSNAVRSADDERSPSVRLSLGGYGPPGPCVKSAATLAAMASFDRESFLNPDVDFRLMANTFVSLFWRTSLLDETIDWLNAHSYLCLDASRWATEEDLHRDLASALSFPDYYGGNLDALNDCMRKCCLL
jgi:hypothetical protein